MVEWRQKFENLRERRPDLAARVCRRLLRDLQKKKLVDLDALDELAAALKSGGRRAHDPNRPKPQLNNDSQQAVKLEELQAISSSSKRINFVKEHGWATMPGETDPDTNVARECTKQIMLIAQ